MRRGNRAGPGSLGRLRCSRLPRDRAWTARDAGPAARAGHGGAGGYAADVSELPRDLRPVAAEPDALVGEDDLPVVARLVVEIRSDGVRTRARGAMVDVPSGQQVAVDVRAGSILELSSSLAKAVLGLPMMLLKAARARGRTRG